MQNTKKWHDVRRQLNTSHDRVLVCRSPVVHVAGFEVVKEAGGYILAGRPAALFDHAAIRVTVAGG